MRKKLSIAFGLGLALVAMAIGITFTYSHDSSVLENTFEIAQTRVQFIDTFNSPSNWISGQTVPKEIKVKNETGVPVVARIKLEEAWDSSDGMGLPLVGAQSNVRMAIINYTEDSGWTLDGTWYYSPVLQPGETSASLITGVTLNGDADLGADWRYGGATYKLSAKAEVIQSDLAATEWHKKAVVDVTDLTSKAISFVGGCHEFDAFERASQKSDFSGDDENYMIQSGDESNTPVYLWIEDNRVKWYSDADDIYLVGNAPRFNCVYLKSLVGFRDFNTSRITSLEEFFSGVSKLASLDGLETWDVSNVTSMRELFYTSVSDGRLADISALARWDVSNVETTRNMFSGQASVADVTALAGWNVQNVTDFLQMFADTSIDESICALADWPISGDRISSWFGLFYTKNRSPLVDAHCLDGWNIPRSKDDSWFNKRAFILPSWAR